MGTLKFITVFTKKCSKPEQIRSVNDCRRVKRWIAKTVVMYVVFSIIAAIISIAIASIPSYPDFIELPTTMAYILVPLVTVLTCWGFATLIMYLPQVIGSVGTAAAKGYEIGESIQTTHVTATHEYGNTRIRQHLQSFVLYRKPRMPIFGVRRSYRLFNLGCFLCLYRSFYKL